MAIKRKGKFTERACFVCAVLAEKRHANPVFSADPPSLPIR